MEADGAYEEPSGGLGVPLPRHEHVDDLVGVNSRLWSRLLVNRVDAHCCPAISTRLELVPRLRGFKCWFTLVTPLCLACRTRVVWQCRPVPSLSGLLPILPSTSSVRLPSASPDCCDSPERWVSHPPADTWRLVAHLHHMKWIGHLDGVGHHDGEHLAIGAGRSRVDRVRANLVSCVGSPMEINEEWLSEI
jgi:hypothetical protein